MLARRNIKRCIGCFTCYAKTPGVCIHLDDMPTLAERIRSADLMILATPVYLDGMTSWAKSLFDRMVVFLDPHFIQDETGLLHPLRWNFPEKMFLVSICGYPGLHNFDPLVSHVKSIARNFHSEFSGALLRPAIFSLLLTRKYPDRIRGVMDAVRAAGREIAVDGKVSAETLSRVAEDICSAETHGNCQHGTGTGNSPTPAIPPRKSPATESNLPPGALEFLTMHLLIRHTFIFFVVLLLHPIQACAGGILHLFSPVVEGRAYAVARASVPHFPIRRHGH